MKRFLFVISVVAAPRFAAAQVAVECPGTAWTATEYTLKIGVDGSSAYPLDPVVGGGPRRYDNMVKHTRKFVANKYVSGAAFGFGQFDTETSFDRFTIAGYPCSGGSCSTLASMTGALGATSRVVDYSGSGQSLTSVPLRLSFTSDSSVTRTGLSLDNTLVKCFGSGISNDLAETMKPGESVDGVLLGPNDIVYLALPGGATPDFHQSVALWSTDTSTDMDLLLACGRRPTVGDYDFASRTSSDQEFIEWSDASRVCTSPLGWFLGVHSYAGSGKDGKGAFHLLYSRHKASQHITLKAAFDTKSCDGGIVPDFAQRADAHAFLSNASAAIYGATDGQVVVNWDLYNASSADDDDALGSTWICGGVACNVRLDNCHGGGQSHPLTDILWIGSEWHGGDGSRITHEFGHAHLGLGAAWLWPFGEDGYWSPLDDPRTQLPGDFPTTRRDLIYNVCGHSSMSNGFADNSSGRYCTTYSHLRNQRYVAAGWETNILTTNGRFDSETGNSGVAYSSPIGVVGRANSWSPVLHSTLWTDVSDWQVGMHNGVLWQEPDGSDDPYEFLDFAAPGFPGSIVDH